MPWKVLEQYGGNSIRPHGFAIDVMFSAPMLLVQAAVVLISGMVLVVATRCVIGVWPALTTAFWFIWIGPVSFGLLTAAAIFGLDSHGTVASTDDWIHELSQIADVLLGIIMVSKLSIFLAPVFGLVRYPSGSMTGRMEAAVIAVVYILIWFLVLAGVFLALFIASRLTS